MIEQYNLLPGVTLRTFRDTRFKQGCLTFQLVRLMDSSESSMAALLPSVLLRGTRRCPDLRSITEYLDELYGGAVGPLVRRVGDYHTTGLCCSFMDDRFALPGDKVMEPMLAFLEELLLDSPLEDGAFLPAFVESEKKNLISTIETERNDKRLYAVSRLLKDMCREDSFGLPRLGTPEQVSAITPRQLYDFHWKILETSPIEIFYVGSAEGSQVAQLLMPLLRKLPRRAEALPPQSDFHGCEGRHMVETLDVAQGKLCLGFTSPITNRTQRFPAMQALNLVFGSGMTSKLFMNVREKMSLCYSIYSSYYGTKGLLVVSAGIDADKEPQTRREILRQLKLCQEGEITEAELTAAKEALLTSLRSVHDTPGSIEGYYFTAVLGSLALSLEDYREAVEKLTVADLVDCAREIRLHTTYFLKGESQNDA